MTVPVIIACQHLKLIPSQNFEAAIQLMETLSAELKPEASGSQGIKALARQLYDALPIVYGLGTWQGYVANRWRCQFNENAKHLAFSNRFPELDHNEIMGWVGACKYSEWRFVGILLEGGDETDAMQTRFRATADLISESISFHTVIARGESLLEKLLSLAYIGDFVSLYLARLNGSIRPTSIRSTS